MTDDPVCKVCHRPTGDTAWLCAAHTGALELLVAEMPALLGEVTTTIARQDRIRATASPRRTPVDTDPDPATEPHTKDRPDLGAKVQALPLHPDAVGLRDEAMNTLTTWVRHLAESRGAQLNVAPTPAALALWLLRAMSSIRLDEGCGDLFLDIRAVHRRCTALVDSREDRVYLGPCGSQTAPYALDAGAAGCCTLDLYAAVDAEKVRCDGWGTTTGLGCGAEHSTGSKLTFLRAQVEEARATWSVLVGALTTLSPGEMPPPGLLRAWKSRGERGVGVMRPVGDRNGEPLWRGGDLLAAVAQWRTLNTSGRMTRGRHAARADRCA